MADQLGLLATIFREAAKVGARSIAIPAVSAGKRGFPADLASAITLAVAATEILASAFTLDVYVIGFGDENLTESFRQAKLWAASEIVLTDGPNCVPLE